MKPKYFAWISLAVLSLAGCGDSGPGAGADAGPVADAAPTARYLEPGFEAALTEHGGCADLMVYAAHPDGTAYIALTRFDAGWVAMANQSQSPVDVELDLAQAEDVDVRAIYGDTVTTVLCNDALEPYEELERWSAISGSVSIHIEPGATQPNDNQGYATVTFSNITFALESNPNVTLVVPSLVISEVSVGWLPG